MSDKIVKQCCWFLIFLIQVVGSIICALLMSWLIGVTPDQALLYTIAAWVLSDRANAMVAKMRDN
jgi:hypothetical protein